MRGHSRLVDNFNEVRAIMRGARNWAELYETLDRSLPRSNETLQLPFYDTQAMKRSRPPQTPPAQADYSRRIFGSAYYSTRWANSS